MKNILTILFSFIIWTVPAQAHFIIDAQVKAIHVEANDDGASVLMRFPLTLAYARELNISQSTNKPLDAAFVNVEWVGNTPYYKLNIAAIKEDKQAFAKFLLRDYSFAVDGVIQNPMSLDFAITNSHAEKTAKSGLAASKAILLDNPALPDSLYISDALVVLSVKLPDVTASDPLSVATNSPHFTLPEGILFETRIFDHRNGTTKLTTFDSLWAPPVVLTGSLWNVFFHFIMNGIHHILFGLDHVLFVLCLVVAAKSFKALLFSVTGFTIGHSITLTAGVLGWLPSGAWFIPFIELLVAISIIFIGLLILFKKIGTHKFWLALGLGLIHGFGFAFMLIDMLDTTSDALISSLFAFNIGVELGQLGIVSIAFILLKLIIMQFNQSAKYLRNGMAIFASIIALFMLVERSQILNDAIIGNDSSTQQKEV